MESRRSRLPLLSKRVVDISVDVHGIKDAVAVRFPFQLENLYLEIVLTDIQLATLVVYAPLGFRLGDALFVLSDRHEIAVEGLRVGGTQAEFSQLFSLECASGQLAFTPLLGEANGSMGVVARFAVNIAANQSLVIGNDCHIHGVIRGGVYAICLESAPELEKLLAFVISCAKKFSVLTQCSDIFYHIETS